MTLKLNITFEGNTTPIKGRLKINYEYLIYVTKKLNAFESQIMKFKTPPKTVIPFIKEFKFYVPLYKFKEALLTGSYLHSFDVIVHESYERN